MTITKKTELYVQRTGQTMPKQIVYHNTWGVDGNGQFAMELMKHALADGCPWVTVDKDYAFDRSGGPVSDKPAKNDQGPDRCGQRSGP